MSKIRAAFPVAVSCAGIGLLTAAPTLRAQSCTPHWSTEFMTGGMNGLVRAVEPVGAPGTPNFAIGGSFTQAGSVPTNRVALRTAGGWSALGQGFQFQNWSGGGNSYVAALGEVDLGQGPVLFAGGSIASWGPRNPISGLAAWTGTAWETVGGGVWCDSTDCQGTVFALAAFDDGTGPALFIGGYFARLSKMGPLPSSPAGGVARWNGAAWSNLAGGISGAFGGESGQVTALVAADVDAGASLYAGGGFDRMGGVMTFNVARWNGRTWSAVGGGLARNEVVNDLAAFDDGAGPALYAAIGHMGGGSPAYGRVKRWNGSAWTTLGPDFSGPVLALMGFDDGNGTALYAGGSFNVVGGGSSFARWGGAGWSAVGGGVNGAVRSLAVEHLGAVPTLLVGGSFGSVGGTVASGSIARWIGCAPCYPDCNQGGTLTVADFGCFQSRFALGDPYADCNTSGTLTVSDFGCFQGKFVLGCP
ncbi:MAG: hypothetical protein ACKVU4_03450 [Phycisphaerales bacterium]